MKCLFLRRLILRSLATTALLSGLVMAQQTRPRDPSSSFSNLASGSTADGVHVYCTDCTKNSDPCTGSGSGAEAYRINGVWVCGATGASPAGADGDIQLNNAGAFSGGGPSWNATLNLLGASHVFTETVTVEGFLEIATAGAGYIHFASDESLAGDKTLNFRVNGNHRTVTFPASTVVPIATQAITFDGLTGARSFTMPDFNQTFFGFLSTASDLTIGDTHYFIAVDASGGNRTETLPACTSTNKGRIYIFKKTDASAGTVTIQPDGSDTIDGGSNLVFEYNGKARGTVCDGVGGWMVQ